MLLRRAVTAATLSLALTGAGMGTAFAATQSVPRADDVSVGLDAEVGDTEVGADVGIELGDPTDGLPGPPDDLPTPPPEDDPTEPPEDDPTEPPEDDPTEPPEDEPEEPGDGNDDPVFMPPQEGDEESDEPVYMAPVLDRMNDDEESDAAEPVTDDDDVAEPAEAVEEEPTFTG